MANILRRLFGNNRRNNNQQSNITVYNIPHTVQHIPINNIVPPQSNPQKDYSTCFSKDVNRLLPSNRAIDDDRYNCIICEESITTLETQAILSCNHQYHTKCINDWLNRNETCPICRTTVCDNDDIILPPNIIIRTDILLFLIIDGYIYIPKQHIDYIHTILDRRVKYNDVVIRYIELNGDIAETIISLSK